MESNHERSDVRCGRSTLKSNAPGLALSAGGARGAYQLGCWKAFHERGVKFSAIAGSSIGALNGTLICQGDWDKAYELWMNLAKPGVFDIDFGRLSKIAAGVATDLGLLLLPIPNVKIAQMARIAKYASIIIKMASQYGSIGALRKYGLFGIEELKPLLDPFIDMKQVILKKEALYITACGEPTLYNPLGLNEWFKIQEHSEEDAWSLVGASMAIPFVFSPVQVNGSDYSDGGIGQWLPIDPLYGNGVRNMIVVSTKADTSLDPDRYPDANILIIQPENPLGRFPIATFKFTEEAVLEWLDIGYNDALKAMDTEQFRRLTEIKKPVHIEISAR